MSPFASSYVSPFAVNTGESLATRPLFARFSRSALLHNARLARSLNAPGGEVLGVIKADAYGHGLLESAAALAGEVDGFAILELSAARLLREAAYQQPILMLEGFHSPAELLICAELGLTIVIHRLDQIEALAGTTLPTPVAVFLKLNTGMNRLGVDLSQARQAYARLGALSQVSSVTVMTHFADADNARGSQWQLDRLLKAWPDVMACRTSFANSAALLAGPATRDALGDIVRPGIMLYGASPWAVWCRANQPAASDCSR